MQIIWYSHSCFLIKTCTGKRILMDPFDNSFEYDKNFPPCDLITISHLHYSNSNLSEIDENTKIINSEGVFDLGYVKLEGIKSFHDEYHGLKRGPNIIYMLYVDNICICHLGDLGCIPEASIINKLNNIDILFIPIGGHFTISSTNAVKLCNILNPKFVIPMNYKTNSTKIYLNEAKDFIINMRDVKKMNSNSFYIPETMPNNIQTILLKTPI